MFKTYKCENAGLVVAGLVLGLVLNAGTVRAASKQPNAAPTTNVNEGQKVNDPLEPINRVTAGFNRIFRKVIADPLISGYQAITPDPVERAIANFASNLTEPVTAVSSVLQGDVKNANNAVSRFFINTTIGMGGLSDQASKMGLQQHREDLGLAAGADGAGSGAHIVLPFFGPSNMRDVTGDILISLVDPLYTATSAVNAETSYAKNRKDINSMTNTAIDPYVVERNAYEQNRQYKINKGVPAMGPIPDFPEDAQASE